MQIGNTPRIRPGPDDTFQSYDLPWANASNTPFRLYKHWVHEGGIATPLDRRTGPPQIAAGRIDHASRPRHGPHGHLPGRGGRRATPRRTTGTSIQPLEGESLLPVLSRAPAGRGERPIFWEHEGNRAVRDGEWKLVARHPGDWELYDMERDRTELHDLRLADPDRAARMIKWYHEWAAARGVLDWPQPMELARERRNRSH